VRQGDDAVRKVVSLLRMCRRMEFSHHLLRFRTRTEHTNICESHIACHFRVDG
jgi:hypothetical protein